MSQKDNILDAWIMGGHLDNVLKTTGEKVLQGVGMISYAQIIEKATEEHKKYQLQNLSLVEEDYLGKYNSNRSAVAFLTGLYYNKNNRHLLKMNYFYQIQTGVGERI